MAGDQYSNPYKSKKSHENRLRTVALNPLFRTLADVALVWLHFLSHGNGAV
jgi:hypothetical protein